MVILRQESLFLFNRLKGKFVPCWAILSFALPLGPSLCVYSDGTTKKILLEKIPLAKIGHGIRFGTTSWALAEVGDGISALISHGTDHCLDKALLLAIPSPPKMNDTLQKKQRRKATEKGEGKAIWMCALTVAQMFDFIEVLSDSLVFLQIRAPPSNSTDSSDALHHYKPRPFRATNEWEMFWNNPPPQQMELNGMTERGGTNEAEDGTQRRQRRAMGWMRGGRSNRNVERKEEEEKRKEEQRKSRGEEAGKRRERKGLTKSQKIEAICPVEERSLAKSIEFEEIIIGGKEMDESEEEKKKGGEEEKRTALEKRSTCRDAEAQTDQNAIGHSFWPLAWHAHPGEEEETVSTQL